MDADLELRSAHSVSISCRRPPNSGSTEEDEVTSSGRHRKAIARVVDEIRGGWQRSESHPPETWIELSGLSGLVSTAELTAFLGAGPATAHQYARALLALHGLGGASTDDTARANAAKEEAARRAQEARKAEAAREAEEARKAEAAEAEEARKAEAARRAEEARKAEAARRAEESRAKAARRRLALGVALLGITMVAVWSIRVTGREGTDGPVFPEHDGGAAFPRADDSTASREANGNVASTGESAADRTHPRISSLVRQTPSANRTNADTVTWRITFTEGVRVVDRTDFVIIGIESWRLTVTKVRALGDVYDLTLDSNGIADHNGTLTLAISPRMTIADYASNRLLDVSPIGIYESSFDVDNAEPRVIFNPESGRIHDPAGNLTLTFTEAVYSDSGGTAFTGSTLAGLIDLREDNESGSDIPFSASIDTDNETLTIDPSGILPALTWVRVKNTYYDTVGNQGHGAAAFTLDTTRPTVTIDGVPATDSGAFMATFTFSEAVTGFTASDVAVTNGTASALIKAQSGRQWHVRITPTGDYSVSLPGDRVTDLAGNGNAASASHDGLYGADITAPRLISIVRQAPSSSPARGDSITWRVTFSEDVEQFTTDSVALLRDQSQVPIAGIIEDVTAVVGSESVYDATFIGSALANHNGTVRLGFLTLGSSDNWFAVSVRDKSSRRLPCCKTLGVDERTFDVDNTAPRVADIVRSNPSRHHTNEDEVAWTVTFSEPVMELSEGGFTLLGTDAAISVTQDGSSSRTWSISAFGGNLASLNGTVTLSFSGTRDIEDIAGNVLADAIPTGADENTFVIDNVAPALTSIVRQPSTGSAADAETATWRLTFSEDMRGVDASDFAIHGATPAVAAAGSKSVYDLSVVRAELASVQGIVRLYFKGDGDITDLAGNALRVPRPPATRPLPSSSTTRR